MKNVAATEAKSTRASAAPSAHTADDHVAIADSGVHAVARKASTIPPPHASLSATQAAQVLHENVTGMREAFATVLGCARELRADTRDPNDVDVTALFEKAERAYLKGTNELECFASTVEMVAERGEVPEQGRTRKRRSPMSYAPSAKAADGNPNEDSTLGDLARMLVLSTDKPLAIAALHTFADELAELRTLIEVSVESSQEDAVWRLERRMRVVAELAERRLRERRTDDGRA